MMGEKNPKKSNYSLQSSGNNCAFSLLSRLYIKKQNEKRQ